MQPRVVELLKYTLVPLQYWSTNCLDVKMGTYRGLAQLVPLFNVHMQYQVVVFFFSDVHGV